MDISPDKQNIDRVFSNTAYYIDFYQRDYHWTDEPVLRLLDDIFFKFREQYARSGDLDPSKETITHYPGEDRKVRLSNVREARSLLKTPIDIATEVNGAEFQMDNGALVVWSDTNSISLWRVADGTEIGDPIKLRASVLKIDPGYGSGLNVLLTDGSVQQVVFKP